MDKKEMKKMLTMHLMPFLTIEGHGFKLYEGSDGFLFYDVVNKDKYWLSIRKLSKVDGSEIQQNFPRIAVAELEIFMDDFIVRNGLNIEPYYLDKELKTGVLTWTMSIPPEEDNKELRMNISSVIVSGENDFLQVIEFMKVYYLEVLFPFFKKYTTLKALNELVERRTMKEILDLLGGGFPIPFYKAMYVSYKTGNYKKYEEIKKEFMDEWIEEAKSSEKHVVEVPRYISAYNDLVKTLELTRT